MSQRALMFSIKKTYHHLERNGKQKDQEGKSE